MEEDKNKKKENKYLKYLKPILIVILIISLLLLIYVIYKETTKPAMEIIGGKRSINHRPKSSISNRKAPSRPVITGGCSEDFNVCMPNP
jgi:competence protein ComGC